MVAVVINQWTTVGLADNIHFAWQLAVSALHVTLNKRRCSEVILETGSKVISKIVLQQKPCVINNDPSKTLATQLTSYNHGWHPEKQINTTRIKMPWHTKQNQSNASWCKQSYIHAKYSSQHTKRHKAMQWALLHMVLANIVLAPSHGYSTSPSATAGDSALSCCSRKTL